ncbi:aminotransferase class I/II-fold pyridoxal phosphate-dependent enzyme [Paenibacillus sanguinis]|uniref:aminotransferase class I/II-fold pyridoxal phosphate-dependent enzyme n=1 Tax=Paenibacillus sanguinis TaxID=225906 RepID=UPI00037C64C6|nr:aminotransferase class I/II-fold pyridoxal phosphate-dependent enzyme [Paenibacillus sanguinis]
MDPGLELLKPLLPHHFAQELEERYREGKLISLAGPQGDGGGWATAYAANAAEKPGQEGEKAGKHMGTGEVLQIPSERDAEEEAWLSWLSEAYNQTEGGGTTPKNILLTDQADEALDLVLKAIVPEGGTVLVETPTSPEALAVIRHRGIHAVPVGCDRDGMLADDLRSKCERAGQMPALIYVTPHYSNPSGRVWSRERKLELLKLSGQFGLPVIEDDTAGAVLFAEGIGEGSAAEARACRKRGPGQAAEPGRPAPSLYRLRQQAGLSDAVVIGIGSWDRTLGLPWPLAWLRSEAAVLERLRRVPASGSARAAELAARGRRLHAWLVQPPAHGRLRLAAAAAAYAAQRKLALALLQAPAWRGACVEDPGGGLFLWLRLPAGISSEALLRASLLEGTAFLPGTLCYVNEPDERFIRLNVAAHKPAILREGLARLAAALGEFTARGAD